MEGGGGDAGRTVMEGSVKWGDGNGWDEGCGGAGCVGLKTAWTKR